MIPGYDPGAVVSVGETHFEVIDSHNGVITVRHPDDVFATYRIRAPRRDKSWLLIERTPA